MKNFRGMSPDQWNEWLSKFFAPRVSIRYKLAIPIFFMMMLVVFLAFRTTYRTVRDQVAEHNQGRLMTIARIFSETAKIPIRLKNRAILQEHIRWMSERPDVLGIRVDSPEGIVSVGDQMEHYPLPLEFEDAEFSGVKKVANGVYGVAIFLDPVRHQTGRLIILFEQPDIEVELRQIFINRFLATFVMVMVLIFVTSGFIWLALRPLAALKRATQRILMGDMNVRVDVRTLDEIQDLAEAFNEMVERLNRSFDSLRMRTEALQESEEKYRLIVEHESDIIFQFSLSGDIMLLNQGFSGYPKEEFYKNGLALFLKICSEDSRVKFEKIFWGMAETKKPFLNISVVHHDRRTREEIYYLINLTPIFDHKKQVKMIQGVMRNVTEFRRIELMKESLIRDVAHELKTPTAKFEMAVAWLEKEIEKNSEMQKYKPVIDVLKSNTERLMKTIMSIMDLSKLESGMEKIHKSPLDLNGVLKVAAQDMQPLCQKKNILLETSLIPGAMPMDGDKDMLYRVFVNLISNSLKFTSKGSIAISSWKDDKSYFATVSDTGVGIDKEDLDRIFDRFFQKTASTAGIGVGLTISRDIVLKHGGEIWAESAGLGQGASFKVRFPIT